LFGVGHPLGDLAAMEQTHPGKFKRPHKIPKNFALLWPSLKKFNGDNGFFLASGIAFNIFVNLIPFIMLLFAVIGTYLYNDQAVLEHLRAYFKNMAPALDPKLMKYLTDVIQARHIVGVVGFVGLLWFSTFVFGSLQVAFNIVFRVEKGRGVLPGIGIDLLMILLAGILLVASMFLSSAMAALQNIRGPVPVVIGPAVQWILKYALPFVLTLCMFFVIYKILPFKKLHFKSVLQAALVTGLLWELAKHLFTWYVVHIARYSVLYGKLNALVLFVLWVYYSSAIVVVGGEFACLLEEDRQRTEVK
jgi:membrane protein